MNSTSVKRARTKMRITQSELARMSGVPRLNICRHELGDRLLSLQERELITAALRKEADRLRIVADSLIGPRGVNKDNAVIAEFT